MLHILGGGSRHSGSEYYGRTVVAAKMAESPEDYNSCGNKDKGALLLTFDDGVTIRIWDDGQSCCESRYMMTDDDPADLVGQKIVSIQTRDADETKRGEYDEAHEVCFVIIQGDKSAITVATHNEHNGYYGGFWLTITEESK